MWRCPKNVQNFSSALNKGWWKLLAKIKEKFFFSTSYPQNVINLKIFFLVDPLSSLIFNEANGVLISNLLILMIWWITQILSIHYIKWYPIYDDHDKNTNHTFVCGYWHEILFRCNASFVYFVILNHPKINEKYRLFFSLQNKFIDEFLDCINRL